VTLALPLAFFGSLTIDDLVFPDGATSWGIPGGNAIYAALGAALWTRQASIVAPIGPDYPRELLDKRLDLSRCPPVSHTLRNWGLYEEDGRRHFVSRSSSRDWSEFCPKPIDARSGSQAYAHVAAMPRMMAKELIEELRRAGTRIISLDLDDHDLLKNTNHDETIELIRSVDLFLPSRQDAIALFPGAEPFDSLRHLRSVAPEVSVLAVKCGADGVLGHIAGSEHWLHVPAVQVAVVDATGAGDAFCGGLMAGLALHDDPMEGLLCGVVSASFCIETFGFAGVAAATEELSRTRLEMLRPLVQIGPLYP